jgi:hypothetical protein
MGRNPAQITGEIGEIFVSYLILKTKRWIARLQQIDYGIDIEAELADPTPTGKFLKIQVKSTESISICEKLVRFRLKKAYIRKFLRYDLPVILVIVDITNEKAYYVYLQEWVERNKVIFDDSSSQSIEIKIPIVRELSFGLENYLKDVALQETPTQHRQKIRKAIDTIKLLENRELLDKLEDSLNNPFLNKKLLPIDETLDEAIKLGQKLRGTQVSYKLFRLCKIYGDSFTIEDIEKLVFRDKGISITGLNALGILYDHYPIYLKELKLADYFKNKGEEIYFSLYYYCKLRERYIEMNEIDIAFNSSELDLEIDGYVLDDYFQELVTSKYPNRGTICFIQCVRPIEIPIDGYYTWLPYFNVPNGK